MKKESTRKFQTKIHSKKEKQKNGKLQYTVKIKEVKVGGSSGGGD